MKKYLTCLIFLICLIITAETPTFGKWTKYYTQLIEDSGWQNAMDISFCDSLNGIIATNFIGSSKKFVMPYLLITSDGGVNWTPISMDTTITKYDLISDTNIILFKSYMTIKVQYLDTNSIFGLVIEDYTKLPNFKTTAVINSTDKGKNWKFTILEKDTFNIGVTLNMLDKKTGMLTTKRYVYLTNDSGNTWKKIIIPEFNTFGKYNIWDAAYLNSKDMILFVSYTLTNVTNIFRSKDNGQTWKKFGMNDSAFFNGDSFFFLDNENGWRCTEYNTKYNGGIIFTDRIYHTSDEGETWNMIYVKETPFKYGPDSMTFPLRIKFLDRMNGIAFNSKFKALMTTDGGKNWISQFPKFDEMPKSDTAFQFSAGCYAGSKDNIFLLDYSLGPVFHYELDPNNVNEENNLLQDEISLSPNPATDFLEISFPDHALKDVAIHVYNVFGEKVLSLYHYSAKLDVSALAPGIYFIRVGEKVGKFIKM